MSQLEKKTLAVWNSRKSKKKFLLADGVAIAIVAAVVVIVIVGGVVILLFFCCCSSCGCRHRPLRIFSPGVGAERNRHSL